MLRRFHTAIILSAAVATAASFFNVAAASAAVIEVHMKNLSFSPTNFSARVGDTIEWINGDFVAHTATARNGDWDMNIPANATRRVVLKRAGTVQYYCRFHPNMTGEITVTAGEAR